MFDRQPKDRIIAARVTQEEFDLILEFASEHNISISNIVVHAVAEYIARAVTQQEKDLNIMNNKEGVE